MAVDVGVHPTTVHGWLTGRNCCGTVELQRVAQVAGVTLERLRYTAETVIVNGQRLSKEDAARVRRFVMEILEGEGVLSSRRAGVEED